MRITVIGVGYVGLVTGACLAEMGHHVTCIDIDQEKIDQLKQGKIPIYEPGLQELVSHEKLHFTTEYSKALPHADVCFIAVGTPPKQDSSVDLTALFSAAESIAEHMSDGIIIATKSTVPVGTAAQLETLIKKHSSATFDIVSNPEFLKEGDAVNDCMKPDRIIIGCKTDRAEKIMRTLYAPFTVNHDRIIVMDIPSAELTKYAANAMLATRISFMNELSHICDQLGADIRNVRIGIGSDTRIGYDFLYAGAGFGGSCFPKDIRALIATARTACVNPYMLEAVEQVNTRQRRYLAKKIISHFGSVEGKRIAIWGLTFKPGTDDMRESPAIELIEQLEGAELRLYDPVADYPNLCASEYDAAEGADAIVLVTEWKQFRFVDLDRIRSLMRGNAFFDGRNQYDPKEMEEKGFVYHGIGVPCSKLVSVS